MRGRKALSIIVFVTLLLSGCSTSKFNGNRTGNESQLIMDYTILNTTDFQMLKLVAGDIVNFEIKNDSGKLNIVFQKDGEKPAYEGTNVPTSSFKVNIDESGEYKVSVTGKKAKGSVSIIKQWALNCNVSNKYKQYLW